MNLTDKEIMEYINEEFDDNFEVYTKEELVESIKNYLSSYVSLEHEIDKPSSDYTKEEIELLKQSFINATTEERFELECRRDLMYRDGANLVHLLYSVMTTEEKKKMLRVKHIENQPFFEEVN